MGKLNTEKVLKMVQAFEVDSNNWNKLGALRDYVKETYMLEQAEKTGGKPEAVRLSAAKKYLKDAFLHGNCSVVGDKQYLTDTCSAFIFNPGAHIVGDIETKDKRDMSEQIERIFNQFKGYEKASVAMADVKKFVAYCKAENIDRGLVPIGDNFFNVERLLAVFKLMGSPEKIEFVLSSTEFKCCVAEFEGKKVLFAGIDVDDDKQEENRGIYKKAIS